jgi:uncharacterized membrane protein
MIHRLAIGLALLLSLSVSADAQQQSVTVQSLLRQDFAVVGAANGPRGGANLFLQKKDKLYFCFVSETPSSATVATKYCKPVE